MLARCPFRGAHEMGSLIGRFCIPAGSRRCWYGNWRSGVWWATLCALQILKQQMITAKTRQHNKKFRKCHGGALAQIKSKQHSIDLESKTKRRLRRERRVSAGTFRVPRVAYTPTTMPDQSLAMTLELLRTFVPGSVRSPTLQVDLFELQNAMN